MNGSWKNDHVRMVLMIRDDWVLKALAVLILVILPVIAAFVLWKG